MTNALCEVLRRAATGDTLQGDESQLLTQLQLAFRANLEKKHRAATTILSEGGRAATSRLAHVYSSTTGPLSFRGYLST